MENYNDFINTMDNQNKPKKIIGKKYILVAALLLLIIASALIIGSVTSHKSYTPATHIVSEKDTNTTIHIHPNDTVKVAVKTLDGLDTSVVVENPNVVEKASAPINQQGLFTGTFKALQPGTTRILVLGKPHCSAGMACPQFILVPFQTTVVVDK